MSWAGGYVGRPFDDKAWDCWRLVVAVYKEQLSIKLETYGTVSAKDLHKIARRMIADSKLDPWTLVSHPAEFDVALLTGRIKGEGRFALHVGVMVNPTQLLHVEQQADTVLVALVNHTVRNRIVGYYRHNDITR